MNDNHGMRRSAWGGARRTRASTSADAAQAIDPVTGEVCESKARQKRVLTADEQRVRDEKIAHNRALRVALEALSPALTHESDPPLREVRELIDISRARIVVPLLELPRRSGRGLPGSALVISSRDYDGTNGGDDGAYVLVCVTFHDGGSFKCRTRGAAIRRVELRAVASALLTEADRLDAIDAENGER